MQDKVTDKVYEITEILDKVDKYINVNEVFKTIIYCFKDKELKRRMQEYLPKTVPDKEYFTELTIEIENQSPYITHKNSSIYIYGEYKKLSREMTQTPLRISGRLKCARSVSDFTKQIKEIYKAKDVVFIPSGREDIDVMNIGGRPFILKVKEPVCNLFTNSFKLNIYPEIKLQNFKRVSNKTKDHILEGEKDKRKVYRCFVACKSKIEIQRHYNIYQKTPLRVLHRRANITREKEVEILDWQLKEEEDMFLYKVDLRASAGTYIKEFINGDFGRTKPSLNLTGDYADLVYLDVLKIESSELNADLVFEEIQIIMKESF